MNKKYYIREEDVCAMMDIGCSRDIYVGSRGQPYPSKELAEKEIERLEALPNFDIGGLVVEEVEE